MKILETYTTKTEEIPLPEFLKIEKEITKDKSYSMYNLSLKEADAAPGIISHPVREKFKSPGQFAKLDSPPNGVNGKINGTSNGSAPVVQNGKSS